MPAPALQLPCLSAEAEPVPGIPAKERFAIAGLVAERRATSFHLQTLQMAICSESSSNSLNDYWKHLTREAELHIWEEWFNTTIAPALQYLQLRIDVFTLDIKQNSIFEKRHIELAVKQCWRWMIDGNYAVEIGMDSTYNDAIKDAIQLVFADSYTVSSCLASQFTGYTCLLCTSLKLLYKHGLVRQARTLSTWELTDLKGYGWSCIIYKDRQALLAIASTIQQNTFKLKCNTSNTHACWWTCLMSWSDHNGTDDKRGYVTSMFCMICSTYGPSTPHCIANRATWTQENTCLWVWEAVWSTTTTFTMKLDLISIHPAHNSQLHNWLDTYANAIGDLW